MKEGIEQRRDERIAYRQARDERVAKAIETPNWTFPRSRRKSRAVFRSRGRSRHSGGQRPAAAPAVAHAGDKHIGLPLDEEHRAFPGALVAQDDVDQVQSPKPGEQAEQRRCQPHPGGRR